MSEDFPITIFHNPNCGTSRNVLAMIRAAGYQPTVIEYLKVGWDRSTLESFVKDMPARPSDFLREKGTPAADLGLLDARVSDDAILDAMIAHPILVNRPIVITPLGVKLCRPSEALLPMLARHPNGFTKDDGAIIAT